MVSFGYQTGDGTGTNTSIITVAGIGSCHITPYPNDTGGYVLVDTVVLKDVHTAQNGTYYAAVYLFDHENDYPTTLLDASDLKTNLLAGDNSFTFSAPAAIVHPGQWVGVALLAVTMSGSGQTVRCDGADTLPNVSRMWVEDDTSGHTTPPATPAAGGWLDVIIPFVVSGSVPGSLPSDQIRVASVAQDSALEGYSKVRVAQLVSEPLSEGYSKIRVPHLVSEPLTEGYSKIRVPELVLEVLCPLLPEPYMSTEVLPTLVGLSWTVTKSPKFSTKTSPHVSGQQVRNAFYQYPIWEFKFTYDYLPDVPVLVGTTDLKNLLGFFLKRQGSFDTWLYQDPDDYIVTAGSIFTGDGVTTQVPILRSLGGFSEPIGQLNTGVSYVFKKNGTTMVEGTDYSITMPNLLVFPVAPSIGDLITGSFHYYFRCHFMDDREDFDKFSDQLWELGEMKFESVIGP